MGTRFQTSVRVTCEGGLFASFLYQPDIFFHLSFRRQLVAVVERMDSEAKMVVFKLGFLILPLPSWPGYFTSLCADSSFARGDVYNCVQ